MVPKKKDSKWKPIYVLTVYRLTRMGMPDYEIVKVLGVTRTTFDRWRRSRPELQEAIALARKESEESGSFPKWVYSRLSPQLKALWDQIESLTQGDNGVVLVEALLQDHGVRVRQQLFLHALCFYNFNPSAAMGKVNVSRAELNRWLETDPDFAELVREVQWHKGNFFEDSLVALVKEGNPAAVVFANKTFNKDRGYVQRQEVEVSGQVLHAALDLNELAQGLSEGARLELLAAVRRQEEKRLLTHREMTPEERVAAEVAREGSRA